MKGKEFCHIKSNEAILQTGGAVNMLNVNMQSQQQPVVTVAQL